MILHTDFKSHLCLKFWTHNCTIFLVVSVSMVLDWGRFCPCLRKHLEESGDIFGWHTGMSAICIQWVEVRDIAKHPTM